MTLESNLTCDVINAPRCDVSDHAAAWKSRGLIRSTECSLGHGHLLKRKCCSHQCEQL